ncbi:hypothetical protein PORCAN_1798 [Porphyromonas crevioricanis JCM 13913]|nr:hypothetical protein PORCAN_1798 [Porphyromonas crevioricanis JCM 13913]
MIEVNQTIFMRSMNNDSVLKNFLLDYSPKPIQDILKD